MTKNERSLQWVIAGIFFVVCFAFFQWIYPNHLFFKEQMRIFLYTTDYFISFKSRKTKRDGCEKRNAFIETKTKCASNLIRKATVHLQNQSKTPSF